MRRTGLLGRIGVGLLAILGVSACDLSSDVDPGPRKEPRLVLLYAPCTVSRQFLSPYEPSIRYTPHLAELASEAMVFDSHYTEAGQSGISYASLVSGGQADLHEVFRHPSKIASEPVLITEAFAASGYEPFYWNDHLFASAKLRYARGVPPKNRHVKKVGEESGLLEADDPAFVSILDRLTRDPNYKAFVLANPVVTHGRYSSEHLERFLEEFPEERGGLTDAEIRRYRKIYYANYFGLSWNFPGTIEAVELDPSEVETLVQVIELLYSSNVYYLDELFGAVVEAIRKHDLSNETVIAFTTDHGEVMYRETAPFAFAHGLQLAPEVLNVPWIVFAPGVGVPAGRYPGITRSTDVFPTLAGLGNVKLQADRRPPGVDLSPALRGRASPPELSAFSHTTVLLELIEEQMADPDTADSWAEVRRRYPDDDPSRMWAALVEAGRVYKRTSRDGRVFETEVYDRADDPGETRNLYDPEDPVHRDAERRLVAYRQAMIRAYEAAQASSATRRLPRRREAAALRALGYVE